jgi:hypothetical protein
MTEVRFSGLSSLSFLDGRGTCSLRNCIRSPSFHSEDFAGLCVNSIFSSILRKISARFGGHG